jgi:8-oxo-dGTP diphosphatase
VVAPGGHVEPGETPPVAVAREVLEETGLIVPPDALRPLGSVEFRFPHRREWEQVTHVFGAEKWSGQQQDSRELLLSWHRLHELPLRQMWDDARFWLPLMLAGQRLHARFTFAADCATVTEAVLRPELG